MMKVRLKNSFLLAIITVFIPFFAQAKEGISYEKAREIIIEKKLYESKEWLYLLHYEGSNSVVDKKSSFFISPKGYKRPKHEMIATFDAFMKDNEIGDESLLCKFPARLEYIEKNTGIKFPKKRCENYEEFENKVPMDKISLVFASENNTVPTSIMGHIFLKMSGNSGGKYLEHAFSYFATDFNDKSVKSYLNVLFSSIDGIYALSPYQGKRDNYLYYEQRTIWEIDLKLTEEQKSYLQKHMWELKNQNVRYSFIFHNCGTGAVNLLKVVYGDLPVYKIFPTPVDYVKKFERDGNIEDISLIPSPEYHLKMVRDNYDLADIYIIKSGYKKLNDNQKYLANMLHNYNESMGIINNPVYHDVKGNGVKKEMKNILNAKPSSSIYAGYRYFDRDGAELEIMPLYQDFFDVSKAYFDDFETKIATTKMVYDGKFYVERFDVFSMRSIIDASMSWSMLSKHLKVSFENSLGERNTNLRPVFEAGAGYAFSLFDESVKPYILPKAGYRYDKVDNFYLVPEYGIIMKPIEDIKIILTYEKYFNSKRNNRGFDEEISANFAYLLTQNSTFYTKYNKYGSDNEFTTGIGVSF